MHAPVIGITLDSEEQGSYSQFPYYALRQNYFDAVAAHGAVPLGLPQEPEHAHRYIELISGLVVSGGAFDIPPSMYGAASQHEAVTTKDKRTQFEWAMLKLAIERQMPILGICGGEQLINVVLGGSLVQHIPDEIPAALQHEVKDRTGAAHEITIVEGSLLHSITGVTQLGVNTSHHQAVKAVAPGVVATAHTSDGVIEAIEYSAHPFCLGVQWHPEYSIHAQDRAIIKAFVEACRR